MKTLHLLAATVVVGAVAAPAAAQQPYPQTYPVQTYSAQPYGYPGQGTGTNVVEQIINQLLGNNSNYTVSDRTQVSRCATAALAQAGRQYGRYGYGSQYGQPNGQAYGYGQQYGQGYNPQYGYANGYGQMRVTAITDVQRRSRGGLRIQGLISSGAYAQPYGYGYGGQYQGYQGQEYQDRRYADPRYAQAADLSFRCNVDYRGGVSGIRVSRYTTANRR
jgi:hypothetical protein